MTILESINEKLDLVLQHLNIVIEERQATKTVFETIKPKLETFGIGDSLSITVKNRREYVALQQSVRYHYGSAFSWHKRTRGAKQTFQVWITKINQTNSAVRSESAPANQ